MTLDAKTKRILKGKCPACGKQKPRGNNVYCGRCQAK